MAGDASQPFPIQVCSKVDLIRFSSCYMRYRLFELTPHRFLYIRALLLRPVLLAAVQGRNADPLPQNILSDARLEQQIIIRICTLCVSTVHALAAHLQGNLNVVYRRAGWQTVHCELYKTFLP